MILEWSVGAVTLLPLDFCGSLPADTEDREADDREENDNVDPGGDCGGRGIVTGSILELFEMYDTA